MKKDHLSKIILSVIIFLALPLASKAAIIYIDPAEGTYGQGDTIIAKIKIDNQGECINAAGMTLTYSESLRAVDFSSGNSILNIWIDQPDLSDINKINLSHQLSFSGGIPGGYCGPIQGDQGESNILAEVVFTANNSGSPTAEIKIADGAQLLLNDGKGTPAKVAARSSKFNIGGAATQENSEWAKRLEEDDVSPEPFTVELMKDSRVYDGKYYIIFSTSDKQTGVDHFEVLENKPEKEFDSSFLKGILQGKQGVWKVAQSPYLLEDQSLKSDIFVKAIDKAGNERTVKYFFKESLKAADSSDSTKSVLMVLLGILVVALPAALLIRTLRIVKIKK